MYNAAYLTSIERKTAQNQTLYTHRYTRYNLNGALAEAECVGKSGNIFYDYDEKDRLTAIQSPCWSETLEYNGMGNTISIRLEDPSGAVSSAYQYDCRQQLTRETGIAENSYAYDSISNRTAKNDMDYYVDALTQLTAAGDTLYAYDPNGNLLETKNNKALTHYEYDALNRMTQATQERSFKVAFTYDALNRRLSKTSYRWNPEENRWREAGALRYLYDESNEIGAVNKSGEIKELRVLGTGLGAEIGAAIAIELDGSIYAPIHDHRGSVCCLIDASSGKAVEWTRYSAFGEEHTQSTLNNPWRFSGKRTDKETGLLFFGKRYYDPDIGRWITKDPLGTPEGINRYAFAQNQPIDRIDLYGLFSIGSRLNSIWSWIKQAYQFANTGIHNFQKNYSFDNYIRPTLDKIAPAIIGQPILYLAGYYNDKSETGVHGRGELSDKVRITLINGILNARVDYKATMDNVSEAHGGVNIHYIFDASDGWTWDLFKAFFAKAGYKASQAYQLTETWRAMIAEMGGTDGGGTIIHYAHSLGGTHTQTALGMLSPEERKMIHVYTFGSASMIYDSGLETIVNFISVRDAIAICDPIGFLSGLFGFRKEVNTVGNWFGIPLIDHMIGSRTYREIIKALGKQFLQLYVEGAV
jgi:RHS repeat-associated protein